MIQLDGDFSFAGPFESLREEAFFKLAGLVQVEHLDRVHAIGAGVPGAEDLRHAPLSNSSDQFEPGGQVDLFDLGCLLEEVFQELEHFRAY